MRKTHITIKDGKVNVTEPQPPPPDPPPPPPPDPNWPYSPEADAIALALARALQHYLAIRAQGSTPAEGGPSFAIAERTIEAFSQAAELARQFWPTANSFELIGSDSHFPAARIESDGLPENATLLRLALPIAQFSLKQLHPTPMQADYTAVQREFGKFTPPPPAIPKWER